MNGNCLHWLFFIMLLLWWHGTCYSRNHSTTGCPIQSEIIFLRGISLLRKIKLFVQGLHPNALLPQECVKVMWTVHNCSLVVLFVRKWDSCIFCCLDTCTVVFIYGVGKHCLFFISDLRFKTRSFTCHLLGDSWVILHDYCHGLLDTCIIHVLSMLSDELSETRIPCFLS